MQAFVLVALLLAVGGEEARQCAACFPHDFSSKSPYCPPEDTPAAPATCLPRYFVLVTRHGSRRPTKDKTCRKLEEDLGWECRFPEHLYGTLSPRGVRELTDLGERLARRYPNLFSEEVVASPHRLRIQSTALPRTGQSAMAFALGMQRGRETVHPVHIQNVPPPMDSTLRFFDNCPRYRAHKESPGTQHTQCFASRNLTAAAARISGRLGRNVSWKQAKLIYTECVFNLTDGTVPGTGYDTCSLLSDEDFAAFAYYSDLSEYYEMGPGGAPLAVDIACPLLTALLTGLREAAEGKSPLTTSLYFAHAETLVPLLTLLGLYRDLPPLTCDTSVGWEWRLRTLSPMAGNLAMVLHQCDGEWSVELLHNERPVRWPVPCPSRAPSLPDHLCPLRDLLAQYTTSECNHSAFCTIPKSH